jgi:hypothetical protein
MLLYIYVFIFLDLHLTLHLLELGENPVVEDLALVPRWLSVEILEDLETYGGNLLGLIVCAQPLEGVGGGEDQGTGYQAPSSPLLLAGLLINDDDFPSAVVGKVQLFHLADQLSPVLSRH